MKTIIINRPLTVSFLSAIFLTLILTLFSIQILPGQNGGSLDKEAWEMQKEGDGIRIYTRWVEAEPKRKAREMKIVLTIKAPPQQIIEVIRGENADTPWMDQVKQSYPFDISTDRKDWYNYTEFKLPWPINNQDVVTLYQLKWEEYPGTAHIDISSSEGKIPEKKGINRIEYYEGSWYLSAKNEATQVEYRIFSKSKPLFPRWITDPLVHKNLIRSFNNLRQLALK